MSYVMENAALNANLFAVEIKGANVVSVGSVEGLQVENMTTEVTQQTAKGVQNQMIALGRVKFPGELNIKRVVPADFEADPFWKWMTDIRKSGSESAHRKDGSVVVYNFSGTEVSRWNFFGSWPSKIAQDGVDASKGEVLHETITLQYQKLERIK